MVIDNNRRSTLKIMALASGALAAPSMVTAACQHGVKHDYAAGTAIRGTGLVVSFSDKPESDGTRRVIVTNTSSQPVTLSAVYPSVVTTSEGQYDLNSLLVNGTRQFAPKQATTLTIRAAKNGAINTLSPPLKSADALLSVRTRNPAVNGGEPVTTMRGFFS